MNKDNINFVVNLSIPPVIIRELIEGLTKLESVKINTAKNAFSPLIKFLIYCLYLTLKHFKILEDKDDLNFDDFDVKSQEDKSSQDNEKASNENKISNVVRVITDLVENFNNNTNFLQGKSLDDKK